MIRDHAQLELKEMEDWLAWYENFIANHRFGWQGLNKEAAYKANIIRAHLKRVKG